MLSSQNSLKTIVSKKITKFLITWQFCPWRPVPAQSRRFCPWWGRGRVAGTCSSAHPDHPRSWCWWWPCSHQPALCRSPARTPRCTKDPPCCNINHLKRENIIFHLSIVEILFRDRFDHNGDDHGRSQIGKMFIYFLPSATFPVKVSLVEVQLVWYPHYTLAEVLLVDDEVAAILAALHPNKVLCLVIIFEVRQQLGHGDPLLTRQVHTVYKSVLTLQLMFRYGLPSVLFLLNRNHFDFHWILCARFLLNMF